MAAYTFNTEEHTMTAYHQAATKFTERVGGTPMDVLSDPDKFSFEIREQADYLNAWDLFLFNRDDADG